MSKGSRFCFGQTGITEAFVAVLGLCRHVLGRDFSITLHSPCFPVRRLVIEGSLAAWTHSPCGVKRWDVCESGIRMNMKGSIYLLFLGTFSVFRHVNPPLGNDSEINNYTKSSVINGTANKIVSTATRGYNNNGKNFLWCPCWDVISRTSEKLVMFSELVGELVS
jgi:hypothetical protein